MTGRLTTLVLFAFLAGGCVPSDDIPNLYPLTGTVAHNGKPVTSGGLLFAPVAGGTGGVNVDANVNKDGTFTVQSSKWSGKETVFRLGIKPGRYKVTYIPATDGARTGLEVELATVVVVEEKANNVSLELPEALPMGNGEPRDDATPADPAEPKSESKKD